MNEPVSHNLNDELDWLAFQYVAGELTADEEEQFERRLAEDQTAREAVERAVELKEAIQLASASWVPARRTQRRLAVRRSLAWAGALAASLLLAIGLLRTISTTPHVVNPPPDRNLPEEDSRASEAVARTWVELRRSPAPEALAADTPPPEPLVASEFGVEDVTETDVSVPQWMLTAFAAPPKRD
jgi:ferric-dicitrate binding protein FerR (iron transport regulator)